MPVLASYLPGSSPAGLTFARTGSATYVTADGVVATAGTGVLRDAHYINGVRYTLLESVAATNLSRLSELWTASAGDWAGSAVTITANAGTAPDGTVTANLLVATVAGAHSLWSLVNGGAGVAAGVYTSSWWAQNVGGTFTPKYSVYNETAGTDILAATAYTITNGLTRVSVTYTVPAGSPVIRVYPIRDSAAAVRMLGWGMQHETGAIATSYIRTTGTAVTRNGDSLWMPYSQPPQEQTALIDFIDLGGYSQAGIGSSAWGITDTGFAFPEISAGTDGTNVSTSHTVSSQVLSTVAGLPALNDRVEMRSVLNGDGSVVSGRSFNQASESVGTASAANIPAAQWFSQQFWLGGVATFGGAMALRSMTIATGVRSLAEMRTLVTQTVEPVSDVAAGTWTTDTGGTTNLWAAVDDDPVNDADYIQSVSAPVAELVKLGLGSPGVPFTGPWTLMVRHKKV